MKFVKIIFVNLIIATASYCRYVIKKKVVKRFLLFCKTELSTPNLKKFQEGTFGAQKIKNTYSEKIAHIFLQNSFLIIFQEETFRARKIKQFLYFQESWSHLDHILRSKGDKTAKNEKKKIQLFLFRMLLRPQKNPITLFP